MRGIIAALIVQIYIVRSEKNGSMGDGIDDAGAQPIVRATAQVVSRKETIQRRNCSVMDVESTGIEEHGAGASYGRGEINRTIES